MNQIAKGECYCGQVAFAIEGQPVTVINCHCGLCRRLSGAAFTTWVSVSAKGFRLEKSEKLKMFNPTMNCTRHFCENCGTHVFSKDKRYADIIGIPAGVLSNLVKPIEAHYFVSDKAAWNTICDTLAQFGGETGYERIPYNTSLDTHDSRGSA